MGAKDSQLRDAWGNDLTAVNMQKANPADLTKLYERLVRGGKDEDPAARTKAIVNAFNKMELDPTVTQRTLGTSFKNVSLDSIFTTTRKLLAIRHRNDQAQLKKLKLEASDPDDRDSWKIYAEKVRTLMQKVLDVPYTDFNYKQYREFG